MIEVIKHYGIDVVICEQDLIKITIGHMSGNWVVAENAVELESGEFCFSGEERCIDGGYYHEYEFDDYDIVYDHAYEKYVFKHDNLVYGYVARGDKGWFNLDGISYIEYDNEYYISDRVAEYYNIYFCGDCETMYHDSDECNCASREDDEYSYCYGYHNKERGDYSENSVYKIGLEIEKEDKDCYYQSSAEYVYNNTGWVKEHDGSLDGEVGFELISPILQLDIETNVYKQNSLINKLNEVEQYINANYSDRCGGHINISELGLTSIQLLEKIAGYLPLFYSIYEKRLNNSYSFAKPLAVYKNGFRHAFNCKAGAVLEIRLFPAVKNLTNLLWRIELVRLILKNHTSSYKVALKYISNPKHEVHQHLLKIFSKSELFIKTKYFIKYLAEYENKGIHSREVKKCWSKIARVA